MSIHVMSWVWKHSKAKGNERLVLLAIADRCDDEGRNAWPSVSSLVTKTLLSERTVQSCVRRLVDRGELEVQQAAGPRGTNVYVVTMTPAKPAPPQISHPADCDLKGCEICGERGAESAPNTSSTSKTPPPSRDSVDATMVVDQIPDNDQTLDLLVDECQRLVRAARGAIFARRWTTQWIQAAIDNALDADPARTRAEAWAGLRVIAADPETEYPARLTQEGPWWLAHAASAAAETSRLAAERRAACSCANGWLPDDDAGRAVPCPDCRPARREATA